ncbi:MFS transporter [Catenuloplanes atrovinosus]|uniref:EmrB/QacA subfamily drug resistance transporter n=1 Tax=Catenuloplanes atrovinosus TaxID=137266 RepID=A0AAE3YUL9_9ACTN|nr:MFS transporter [Catenuloplanes atrovinosus]MDR7278673.1 EmrB/QacA subfamily drug resistance transporter [Catenuloplanes atrovinosus]
MTDPAHGRRWLILAVLGVAQLMVVLDATIVNIALPTAQRDLGFSDADRQWVITAYALAFGSLLLLGGRIADLFGRKTTFLTGLAGFAIASALGGAAPTFEILVAARALQGIFGALLAPAALSLLTTTFTDPSERGKAFGIFGALAGGGGGIGLLLGGVLTEHLSWRWCLYVNLIFAAAAFAGGVAFLSRQRPAHRPTLDIPGVITVSAGLFGLVYGFANAETEGWSDPSCWGFLAAGVLLIAVFVGLQTRVAHPLLPLRVILDRGRAGSYIAVAVSGAGIFGVSLFLTYYLQAVRGYSPVETGLAFLPQIGGTMLAATTGNAVLVRRFGARPLVTLGMVLSALGMAWMTLLEADSGYAAHVLPPLVTLGIGFGLIIAPAMSSATSGVDPADAGVASATVNTSQQVGGSIGTALLNTLAASAASDYLTGRQPTAEAVIQSQLASFHTAFWWTAAFFAIGALTCGLLLPSGRPIHNPDAEPALVH